MAKIAHTKVIQLVAGKKLVYHGKSQRALYHKLLVQSAGKTVAQYIALTKQHVGKGLTSAANTKPVSRAVAAGVVTLK